MSMMQTYDRRRPERIQIENFLLWLAKSRLDKPRVTLCEQSALGLGWLPATESHTELIDSFQGINRAELDHERLAAQASGSECPCENQ
jgi:hypothetical protein